MSYLTTLDLKPNIKKDYRLYHLGAYHNLVEHAFPNEIAKHVRLRHLWSRQGKHLLIVSDEKPDIVYLNKIADHIDIMDYDSYLNALQNGQELYFRLTVNPIKRNSHNSSVTVLTDAKDQLDWLIARSENNGFVIVNADISEIHYSNLHRRKGKGGRTIKMANITFTGHLKITDVNKFRDALVNGVGRERAFGMGLIDVSLDAKNVDRKAA